MPSVVPPSLLAGLNPEQTAAATQITGPVRILAGAGTGKTKTITHRIAGQIISGAFKPSQVLAVTYTERAAAELQTRIRDLVGSDVHVRAVTFHSAAWAQLRHFWNIFVDTTDAPGFDPDVLPQVLSSKIPLLASAARRLGVDVMDLAAEVEWTANADLTLDQIADSDRTDVLDPAQLAAVVAAYTEAKHRQNAIDYEDMLRLAKHLMKIPAAADVIRDRYRAFTVDEFQDTNRLQWRLLQAWVGDRDDLCVVGDPAQTIFGFTGASALYLNQMPQTYPGTTTIRLDRSYRSTPQILRVANRVLRDNETTLRATIPDDDANDVAFDEYDDAVAEATGVIEQIQTLAASGVPYRDMAICYRINAQAAAWEEALFNARIPAQVHGLGSFYDLPEVKQAIRALVIGVPDPADREVPPIVNGPVANPSPVSEAERILAAALSWRLNKIPEGRKARERHENIEAVYDEVVTLSKTHSTLPSIAEALAERVSHGEHHTPDAVTLMSLHRSKGAEFYVVFLVGVEEGLVPIHYADSPDHVAEERRLFYVGVTRAKRHLSISWTKSRLSRSGTPRPQRPSRFLYGLGRGAPTGTRRTGKPPRDVRPTPSKQFNPDADPGLVDRLRAWRLEQAKSNSVPPYIVFNDVTLHELAAIKPQTRSALLAVPGIGPAKADRYGDAIFKIVAARQSG